jgi:hypothetical protein
MGPIAAMLRSGCRFDQLQTSLAACSQVVAGESPGLSQVKSNLGFDAGLIPACAQNRRIEERAGKRRGVVNRVKLPAGKPENQVQEGTTKTGDAVLAFRT